MGCFYFVFLVDVRFYYEWREKKFVIEVWICFKCRLVKGKKIEFLRYKFV